jgi:GH25 family lysozyme M1 (1,4-beta-N-acetylmuramidase)
MLVTEARWHHDEAIRAGKSVLWRAIPNLGRRPAELGWSPSRFATEALNQVDAAKLPISGFTWANELDLQDERGDREDDWNNLATRYSLIGGFAEGLLPILRSELDPNTRIHFPAFTPDHGALNYRDFWLQAALRHDVIDFHAYDNLEKIQAQYYGYRQAFPDKMLALTEWHCKGWFDEEVRVLQWLADTMAEDPLFDAAYRFIWRWDDAPGWWDASYNVEPRADFVSLFMNPPKTVPVEVTSEPEPEPTIPVEVTPVAVQIPGIDISNHQGQIDWAQVAANNIKFAMIKATEGTGFHDRFFLGNWANAKGAGLLRGAYHFGRPSLNDAISEADYFLNFVQPVMQPGDILVLDMEDSDAQGDVSDWVMEWLSHVTERVGFMPMLYTGPWYLNSWMRQRPAEIGNYGLWLAAYQADQPATPSPWPVMAIWQYSDAGRVGGISGNVDTDVFFGTSDQLRKYGMPDPVSNHEPDPAPDPKTYTVGSGLLGMMQANLDEPVSDEVYHSHWSQAEGKSGITYVWWTNLHYGQMFPPGLW